MKAVLGVIGLSVLIFANYVEADEDGHDAARCTEGSRWHDECRGCWCGGGRQYCSRMGCPDNYDALHNGGRSPCKDGSRWLKDDCNWCDCVDKFAVCTEKACLPGGGQRGQRAISAYPQEPQPDQDRCQLHAVSGPCVAINRFFRFNSETNRCEKFLYGGCQTNDNWFDTLEECQQTCGGSSPVIDLALD